MSGPVLTRRQFLKGPAAARAGLGGALSLGVSLGPAAARAQTLRIAGTKEYPSVCPYCAVGCGTIISARVGKLVGPPPVQDRTLQDPNTVFQIMRRHYARYTPELVEEVCGTPRDVFIQVAKTLLENSGPDKTTAFAYAVGWTQHTSGVQLIRTATLVQLLLGNIGRPGGGILALHVEGEEQRRAATCDECRGYLKLLNALTPIPPYELPVHELADLHLDRVALQRGYAPA